MGITFKFSDYESFKAYLFLHQEINNKAEAEKVISDLLAEKDIWNTAYSPSKKDDCLPQIYITLAEAYRVVGKYQDSIETLNDVLKILGTSDYQYYFEYREVAYQLLSRVYCHQNERDKAIESMNHSIYNTLQIVNKTHYDQFDFYSFRNVSDYSIADLKNNTISLCSPLEFNDPVDTALFPWLELKIMDADNKVDRLYYEVLQAAYSNLRARCFVRLLHLPLREGRDANKDKEEVGNTLMWSHYTKFHQGFCVKYQIPSNFTMESDGSTVRMFHEISYKESFDPNDNMSSSDAFFTKSIDWEYEHEKRLIYFNSNGSEPYPTQQLPNGCIKAVYIGLKCSEEDTKAIMNALENKPDVKIFRMCLSRTDIYKIKATEIDRQKLPNIVDKI